MTSSRRRAAIAALAAFTLLAAACGSDGESSDSGTEQEASGDTAGATSGEQSETADSDGGPTIVVTTNVLGDVVEEIVGGQARVVTVMPVGADPHDFQASAQEVDQMVSADALVTNGAGFEEGLLDVIENARDEGVPTHEAISAVDTIEFGEGGHDDHDDHDDEEHSDEPHPDEEHSGEEHDDDDHDHDHEGVDPHFFNDPMRMAAAVEGVVGFLTAQVPSLDQEALESSAAAYVAELEALDAEIEEMVAGIPDDERLLVTNHEVFGYFADRYGFEVIGAVIPGGTTTDAVSAGELAELAEVIEVSGVPAIFSDTSSSDELINVLAAEVGELEIVELYTESLGESGSDGETYLDMQRSNGERISAALA